VYEQPATCMDEEAGLTVAQVAVASLDILDVDLAGGKQIHAGDRSVADGDHSLAGVYIDAGEVVEVVEEGTVRGTHGQLNLG